MDPEETAAATADAITSVASHFMMAGATYKTGAELGFAGVDFYVVGRGGALGDVDADVVAAAFVFFNPEAIRTQWAAGTAVMAPRDAAARFAGCAHGWAEHKVPDDVDYARLADLAGAVAAAASPAGAPLFAAWRTMPEPSSAKALAVHRMNLLRELRGGLHGGAVLAAGLRPVEAVVTKTPHMAGIFGWSEPYPDTTGLRTRWEKAEVATNRAMARAFDVLDDVERDAFARLAGDLHRAVA